ncbi:MAG: long-chain fatty acid--CoA ligase [Saprospiraceae bacterium]
MTIYQQDWTAKWAQYAPDKIAFREFETGRTYTYGTLNQLGNRLARHLVIERGLKKGDRIAIISENCLEYMVLFAAAQKTGCILVPLNYRLTANEIDFLIQNAAPSMVIWQESFGEVLERSEAFASVANRWSMNELASFCNPDLLVSEDAQFDCEPVSEDDPIFILYTSGTSGFPKGALYTHNMLFWNSINTALSLIINSESRTVNCMPPFHTGGWNVLTTPFLHHGAYTCMMNKFEPDALLRLLAEDQVTVFMGVPTMLARMAESPEFEEVDLSHMHYIIVGGEAMPIPLIEKWHNKGVPIRQGYGMTEVGPNLTSLHQDDAVRKKGSIGRPNFYVQVRITDEHGNSCDANAVGELQLRGPMVTPGYWQNPEASASCMQDGWFKSGDMAKADEEGFLYIVDRIKNMYISGGENVYPAEIERVLLSHPAVEEAVVVSIPDPKWGEAGKAFVVQKTPVTDSELSAFCRDKLAKFKVPREFEFVATLPRNDSGKINRNALKNG